MQEPATPETETVVVKVYTIEDLKIKAEQAAHRDGRSLSNWIERLILRAIREDAEKR